ncbi:hypothetical protein DKM44_12160 [Deinococcus irradiatisoli]|uniref:Uncharacterized protein n=1 Tax=Deinococcus irradiatisoli TaxID=2202254 RepID=A0A2Z3JFD0_9DEIO|nr:hypothetical protein [Deinococcus irradiatisoli]AWN23887.1 hypothetical protein DKM44_12160 [Deinococcus irradiatisoli]
MTDPNDMNGSDLPQIDNPMGTPDYSGSDLPPMEGQGGLSSSVGGMSRKPGVDYSIVDEDGGTGEAGLSRKPDDAAGAPVHQVSGKKTDEVP